MKKKNGFISMSIIYSFFAVFAIVSTTLLLIYSNNLAIVKSINKEVKQELTNKGNDMLLVFDNLIVDGSFENTGSASNWVNLATSAHFANPLGDVAKEQQYFGNRSMAMITTDTDYYYLVRTKAPIYLFKDHYYYITRVYQSWNHTPGTRLKLYFMSGLTNWSTSYVSSGVDTVVTKTLAYDIMTNARGYRGYIGGSADVYKTTDINSSRFRRESGWCAGVNNREEASGCKEGTYANTLESGIFKFNKNTGDYYLVVGANFNSWNSVGNPFRGLVNGNSTNMLKGLDDTDCSTLCGLAPRYYTDGYMLFDITVAFQLYKTEDADTYIAGSGGSKLECNSKRIDNLLDARYIEGRKEFASHRLNIKQSC